jgi:NAD(P)-dependent dehydrogenase (short-subunit alcohol dehydrogenase family)
MSVYSASKAAVRSFARGWTADLKDRRIRVNTLSPGWIDTPMIVGNKLIKEQGVDRFKSQVAAPVPMGRMGAPEEIANVAVFLASDDSGYITGVELFVDGGLTQV